MSGLVKNWLPRIAAAVAAAMASLAASAGSALVGFIQAGAGAVAGTVQDQLRKTVNVDQFRAVGDADDTAAFQRAFASLGAAPGLVNMTAGKTYVVSGTVPCLAGQGLTGYGAVLDATNCNTVFLSYNVADTFDLASHYPTTLIAGFKVLGKVGTTAGTINPLFVLAKINRTPYVTMRDVALHYAAAAWVLGESILCNFSNVICYNPISTSFNFVQGSGDFGPNNCTLYNCEIEEQKYPCTGVGITSGNINFDSCYIESLATGVILNGGNAAFVNTQFGIRTQVNAVGITVNYAGTSLSINGGSMTFGGAAGGIAQAGIVFNAATELVFNDVSVWGIDGAADSSILFSVKAPVSGTINNNKIHRLGAGAATTIFNTANVAGAEYSGTFAGNSVTCDAGATLTFSTNGGGAGTLQPHIVGNRFVRVSGFNGLSDGMIAGNRFIGPASVISWAGLTPGVLGAGNCFASTGWTVTNAAFISDDNAGLTDIPNIAAAALITPAAPVSNVSGAVAISTITWAGRNTITLIPTGLWATNTAGNIALGTAAVVGKALTLTYNPVTAKWYPSY